METAEPGTSGKGRMKLQPLQHVEAGAGINPVLPAIAKVTPMQGGIPVQSEPGIISLPEGVGVIPSKTNAGIISVPGPEEPASHPRAHGRPIHRVPPLEIVVYFEDKTGINLSVEDGQHADAGELFEIIMDEMSFPAVARDIFSLWLVSDLLELQLKPNQVPFKLVFFWEELLEKYTNTPEEDAERDEPVIVFRRNVFCSRVKDMRIEDPSLLRLLYAEAKENVIDSRYPISQNDCDMLAGIQALIDHTMYLADEHTPDYYRSRLADYYPALFCKRKMKFLGLRHIVNPEDRLAESHRMAARKFNSAVSEEEKKVCYKAYLSYCWKLPYYGAAFFRGQIEHPAAKLQLRTLMDDPVFVAVNTEGVFVIDLDDVEFLMGLLYEELKWEFALPNNQDDRNCIPCLFLQFSADEERQHVTKVLQIFSRQAVLMDSLINASIKLKRQTKAEDQFDGAQLDTADGKQDGVIQSGGETWMNFNRLCLTTFDGTGKRLKTGARMPKRQ